jgi:hypothetical protein
LYTTNLARISLVKLRRVIRTYIWMKDPQLDEKVLRVRMVREQSELCES